MLTPDFEQVISAEEAALPRSAYRHIINDAISFTEVLRHVDLESLATLVMERMACLTRQYGRKMKNKQTTA